MTETAPPPAPDRALGRRIVRTELGIVCATVVTASLLTTAPRPPIGW